MNLKITFHILEMRIKFVFSGFIIQNVNTLVPFYPILSLTVNFQMLNQKFSRNFIKPIFLLTFHFQFFFISSSVVLFVDSSSLSTKNILLIHFKSHLESFK